MCCPCRALLPQVVVSLRFPCDPCAVAVRVSLTPSASLAVSAASYVADPSVSLPLHSALLSALSSRSVPSAQYSHYTPLLITCVIGPCRLPQTRDTIVFVTVVFLFATPVGPLVSSHSYLILPPSSPPPPPPPLGLLRPPVLPALTCTPLPPALAANITCKDKNVGDRTGKGESRLLVAGGSAPYGKCPSRPLAVVGDGIIRTLFLHRPQQYHPVHCRPALRHSHAIVDGPVAGQVECRMQL